ncbi:hypothetical protein ACMD2_15516, partial [Ananas comosus]
PVTYKFLQESSWASKLYSVQVWQHYYGSGVL